MPNIVESLKANAPPPSGLYIGVVIGVPKPINDERREGARFTLEIAEGTFRGRRVPIELITEAKVGFLRARMLSDHVALEMWLDALGVEDAETPTELIGKLRDAAVDKRIEFNLNCNRWKRGVGVDVCIIDVKMLSGG